MTNEELEKEIQKLKEENSSLKSLLEALNTKVAQMQIRLNTMSANVDVNTSYVLANLIAKGYFKEEEKDDI